MSLISKLTTLGAAGAGGDSYWIFDADDTQGGIIVNHAIWDDTNSQLIAMGDGEPEATSGAFNIRLDADGAEVGQKRRVWDTGEYMGRGTVRIVDASNDKYAWGYYNYTGSYEQGQLRVGTRDFGNNGHVTKQIYWTGVYKGEYLHPVSDDGWIFFASSGTHNGRKKGFGAAWSSSALTGNPTSGWDFDPGYNTNVRGMNGDITDLCIACTTEVSVGSGGYGLDVVSFPGPQSTSLSNYQKRFENNAYPYQTMAGEFHPVAFDSTYFYICGKTKSSSGNNEVFVTKIHRTNGTVAWQKSYETDSNNHEGGGLSVDSDGNVYVGIFYIGSTYAGMLLKLNSSGTVQYMMKVTYSGKNMQFNHAEADPYGNVYVCGGRRNASSNNAAVIMKVPSDGSIPAGTYGNFTISYPSVTTTNNPCSVTTISGWNNNNQVGYGAGTPQIDNLTTTDTLVDL